MTDPGAMASAVSWRVVSVAAVRLEMPGVHPEVVLQETDAPWRELRIPVGFAEGTAIAYAWRELPTPRPLTHALFAETLERQGVEILAVRITGRQGGVYLAELDTAGQRGQQVVPCRPSDGVALALRRSLPTPILVAEPLFVPASDPLEPSSPAEADPAP
ncbi:MAG TPA: bifunctional nuclease family protein [Acidimicrobiales bacterium]|nr:bifunctional nuclease family protein [Acidimicrobiales bacterium]